MTELVMISLEGWDEVWRRNQHLMAGLLRAGQFSRVLYVEPAADPVHALRRRRLPERVSRRGTIDLPEVPDGALHRMRPTKWLPRRWDRQGDARRARAIRREANRLGMREPILWVNDPGGAEVARQVDWPALYDITDDWLLAERPEPELERLRRQEAYLMQRCAEVVVCSPNLARAKSGSRDVCLVPNAVDLAAYAQPHARPTDLPDGRVVLYVGTVHRDRIDVELCTRVAGAVDATLVLVGPAPLPPDDADLLAAAGVLLLGPRPSHTIPAYLQHADVLVVPHLLTPFTMSLDPIKAYEYRAARRPVVSTPVPGFVDTGDGLVTVAEGPEDFAGSVAAWLTGPQATTGAAPSPPTWDERVEQMSHILQRVHRG